MQLESGQFRLRTPPIYSDLGFIGKGFLNGKFFSPKVLFLDVSEEYNFLDFSSDFFHDDFCLIATTQYLNDNKKIHEVLITINKMVPVIAT